MRTATLALAMFVCGCGGPASRPMAVAPVTLHAVETETERETEIALLTDDEGEVDGCDPQCRLLMREIRILERRVGGAP